MDSAEEYLEKTKSAVTKILEGIDSYLKILSEPPPVYEGNDGDTLKERPAHTKWMAVNKPAMQSSFKEERKFSAERFALATLCGSLLQIAYMGIQWFSESKELPEDLPEALRLLITPKTKNKLAKFCIGRRVRKVPIGLVIYAGRNQFNHMDGEKLSDLNTTIFDLLASNYAEDEEEFKELIKTIFCRILLVSNCADITDNEELKEPNTTIFKLLLLASSFKDPAFDLKNKRLTNFSDNIIGLLRWENYKVYYSDMHSLIVAA
jgi:hypothetical protein